MGLCEGPPVSCLLVHPLGELCCLATDICSLGCYLATCVIACCRTYVCYRLERQPVTYVAHSSCCALLPPTPSAPLACCIQCCAMRHCKQLQAKLDVLGTKKINKQLVSAPGQTAARGCCADGRGSVVHVVLRNLGQPIRANPPARWARRRARQQPNRLRLHIPNHSEKLEMRQLILRSCMHLCSLSSPRRCWAPFWSSASLWWAPPPLFVLNLWIGRHYSA